MFHCRFDLAPSLDEYSLHSNDNELSSLEDSLQVSLNPNIDREEDPVDVNIDTEMTFRFDS